MNAQTQLLLSIAPGFKPIPYLAAERPEGSTCHGFKLLKGRPDSEAIAIAEAADFDCLASALVAINRVGTPFFTVGCEKAFNGDGETFWVKGFIEFAFNYTDLAADAVSYFISFFHFHDFVKSRGFNEPVTFHWELQGCSFLDADRSVGFTCAVWVTTADGPTAEVVRTAWCAAVSLLAESLGSFGMHGKHRIYGAA